jgi:hypothetical protein
VKTYKDIPYIIAEQPTGYYTAYMKLPDDHPYIAIMRKNGELFPFLDIHDGQMFGIQVGKNDSSPKMLTPGFWVGCEYHPSRESLTKQDVEKECLLAIDELAMSYQFMPH